MRVSANLQRRAFLHAAVATLALPALVRGAAPGALERVGGDPAPKLALNDTSGGIRDIASYRGSVVLVNFWATWCEPCRYEMASIQRLRDKLAGKPFGVLMVNVDEPDARVRRFVADTKLDLPVVMDPGKSVTRGWSVRVLPTTFLVGPDGRLRYRLIGDMDWSADRVVRTITDLLPNTYKRGDCRVKLLFATRRGAHRRVVGFTVRSSPQGRASSSRPPSATGAARRAR